MGNQIINRAIVVGQDEMNREYLNEVFAELTQGLAEEAEGVVDWGSFEMSVNRSYVDEMTFLNNQTIRTNGFFEVHASVLAVTEDEDG